MKARDLRHKVELQTKSTSYNGETWSKLRDQFCRIKSIGAVTTAQLSARGSRVTHTIRFSDFPVVHIGMRAREEWFRDDIEDVDKVLKKFVLLNDCRGYFSKDCSFEVVGSTGNDRRYTVTGVNLTTDGDFFYTELTVAEAIASDKVDGEIILSRTFEIDGVQMGDKEQIATAVHIQ